MHKFSGNNPNDNKLSWQLIKTLGSGSSVRQLAGDTDKAHCVGGIKIKALLSVIPELEEAETLPGAKVG